MNWLRRLLHHTHKPYPDYVDTKNNKYWIITVCANCGDTIMRHRDTKERWITESDNYKEMFSFYDDSFDTVLGGIIVMITIVIWMFLLLGGD